jgi:hypothetical protein
MLISFLHNLEFWHYKYCNTVSVMPRSGVVKLALNDPQGVSETFQGSMTDIGSKGGRWGNESSLNLGDNVN